MATPPLPKLDNLVSAIRENIDRKLQNYSNEIRNDVNTKAADNSVVHTSNEETISGTKTFTSTIVGDITGNAGTCKVHFINLVNNNDDLARVMNFTPSLADIFNNWYRFSHANNYIQCNSSNAEGDDLLDIEAWTYDSENNLIVNNRDTATYVGFVSPDSYDKFTINTEISGLASGDDDDDSMSIIIAFMRDANGIEHHISVVRDGGRDDEEYNKFNLVYDYNYAGFGTAKAVLASGKDLITTSSGWQNHTALLYAERDGNTITVKTTEIDSEDFTATLTYTLPETATAVYDTEGEDPTVILGYVPDVAEPQEGIMYLIPDTNAETSGIYEIWAWEPDADGQEGDYKWVNKGDLDEEDYSNIAYMLSNKCQIGFGFHSQPGQFKLLEMSNIFEDLSIFDAANDVVYEYTNGSFVQTERKVSDELENYARVYNKNIKKEFIYYDGVAYESDTTYNAGSNLSLSDKTFNVSSTPSFTNITISGYTITID